jgi:hypothetical protein
MTEPLSMEYVKRRTDEGWIVTAVEWIKAADPQAGQEQPSEDVPYGQRISADCKHLTEDPIEMDTLYSIYEKVIAGWRPMQIAADLNDRGRHTRSGAVWTPNAVFDLLPRLIELSPRLQVRPDWPARRAALQIMT